MTKNSNSASKLTLKNIAIVLLCIFLGWLWIVGCLYVFQRSLMYHPDTAKLTKPAKDYIEEVKFTTADNIVLTSWLVGTATKDSKIVVFFHGNTGNIEQRLFKAEFFKKQGIQTLLLGYRGFGGNKGSPSEEGFYKDARAAIEFLTEEKKIPLDKIIIYGESIGTGVAVQMATEYKASALILEAPFSSVASVAKWVYPSVPVDLLLKDRYDNIKKIASINMPVLIIHGLKDRIIPHYEAVELFNKAKQPKYFAEIKNGGHNDLYVFSTTLKAIENFIKNI